MGETRPHHAHTGVKSSKLLSYSAAFTGPCMRKSQAPEVSRTAHAAGGQAVPSEGPPSTRPCLCARLAGASRVGWAWPGAARLSVQPSRSAAFPAGSPWRLDAAGSCCSTGSASRRCACRLAAWARPPGAAGSGDCRGAAGGVRLAGVRDWGAPTREAPHSSRPFPFMFMGPARSGSGVSLGALLCGERSGSLQLGNVGLPQVIQIEQFLGELFFLLPLS